MFTSDLRSTDENLAGNKATVSQYHSTPGHGQLFQRAHDVTPRQQRKQNFMPTSTAVRSIVASSSQSPESLPPKFWDYIR